VVLDGQALGNMDGLVISGAHNTVRGLCVQRFTYRNGIAIVGTGYLGNRIEGCNVGTGLDGTTSQGNCANGFWCAGIAIGSNASGNTIGPDNLIAYNYFGVWINPDATGNTITRNAIWGDFGQAIKLVNANKDIAAPTIQRASATQVSGTACAGCTIEVFSDEGSQARYYEGTTTSDGSGLWALNLASPPQGSHVTATSTDGAGNTSTLSDFVAVEP